MGLQSQMQGQARVGFSKTEILIKLKDSSSCKHLCCHEGLDKAPKPPKNFAGPAASLEAHASESGKTMSAAAVKAQRSLVQDRNVNSEHISGFDTIDLTHERDEAENAKKGLVNYRKLHQLHEKVTHASPARVIAHRTPTFSYTKGDRPRIDFLGEATEGPKAHGVLGYPSSDYDIAWMDNLPSPSALIASESRIQSPMGSIRESVRTTCYDEDNSWELEAGMVGLEDSMTLSRWTSNDATKNLFSSLRHTQGTAVLDNDMEKDFPAIPIANIPRSRLSPIPSDPVRSLGTQDREDAIITSTDGSEKTALTDRYNDQVKRKATEILCENDMTTCHLRAKKQKNYAVPDKEAPLISINLENQAAAGTMSRGDEISSGLGDVDPDILAMFRDIVDFV